MAQFVGLGNVVTKIIVLILDYTFRLFFYIFQKVSRGLGKFMEISFEYFVKLFYQLYRFIRR